MKKTFIVSEIFFSITPNSQFTKNWTMWGVGPTACLGLLATLPLTQSLQGIESCEVWDPRHVWPCWRHYASGRTTHVYIDRSKWKRIPTGLKDHFERMLTFICYIRFWRRFKMVCFLDTCMQQHCIYCLIFSIMFQLSFKLITF